METCMFSSPWGRKEEPMASGVFLLWWKVHLKQNHCWSNEEQSRDHASHFPPFGGVPLARDPPSQGFVCNAPPQRSQNSAGPVLNKSPCPLLDCPFTVNSLRGRSARALETGTRGRQAPWGKSETPVQGEAHTYPSFVAGSPPTATKPCAPSSYTLAPHWASALGTTLQEPETTTWTRGVLQSPSSTTPSREKS